MDDEKNNSQTGQPDHADSSPTASTSNPESSTSSTANTRDTDSENIGDDVESLVSKNNDSNSSNNEDENNIINLDDDDDDNVEIDPVGGITVSNVLIELDDNLKSKLVSDLQQICEVDEDTARSTLESYRWSMQDSIDFLLYANNSMSSNEEEGGEKMPMDTDDEKDKPQTSSFPNEGASTSAAASSSSFLHELCSPGADGKKEKLVECEIQQVTTPGGSFSSWAPEKFSVLSWNLDGLDDKNLEKRTDYVINLVEREKHDVLFFQELLPYTFDYIARRLLPQYKPIPGTDDSSCQYLTATFLKKNSVHYEDHYLLPFPNSLMGRTLLVTKAFIGRAKLALLNTHLESTAEYQSQRKVQLQTCFEMASTFDKEYNVIFGGDLNLRDKEVGNTLPSSMVDLWIHCGSRPTCQYTWDLTRNTNKQMPSKFQPRCRFDRFYFRNSDPETLNPEFFGVTGIERVPGTQSFPSDHWAIITFLGLTKEARKPPPRKRRAEIDGLPDDD